MSFTFKTDCKQSTTTQPVPQVLKILYFSRKKLELYLQKYLQHLKNLSIPYVCSEKILFCLF